MDGDIKKIKPEDVGFSSKKESIVDQVETLEPKQEEHDVLKTRSLPRPKFKLPSFSLKPKLGIVGGFMIVLVLLVVGAIMAQLFYSSGAELKIIVDTKLFEQDLDFTLDPEAE